jgi:hypothetical protein
MGFAVQLAAIVAITHRADTDAPVTVDTFAVIDLNYVGESFHKLCSGVIPNSSS